MLIAMTQKDWMNFKWGNLKWGSKITGFPGKQEQDKVLKLKDIKY